MTQEELLTKYGPRMLLFITEAWAVRKEHPSSLGVIVDRQHIDAKAILRDIYNDLVPAAAQPKPPVELKAVTPPPAKPANGNGQPSVVNAPWTGGAKQS